MAAKALEGDWQYLSEKVMIRIIQNSCFSDCFVKLKFCWTHESVNLSYNIEGAVNMNLEDLKYISF